MTFASRLLAAIPIPSLFTLTGCQTFHAGLTDAEFTQRVHKHFEPGMTTDEVRSELRALRFDKLRTWAQDDPDDGISTGDIGAEVWPKRLMIQRPLDYYARDIILFRFGGDDGLDEVVRRPFQWRKDAGEPLVIELHGTKPISRAGRAAP